MTDHGLNRDRSDQPGTPEKKFMHAFKKWLNFANIVGLFLGVITGLKILAGLITVRQFSIDLPIHTILSITLTLAVINLGLAYQTLAGVSLRPSVVWAMLAAILAAIGQARADTLIPGHPREAIFTHLAFLATLAALVSVLGARRPGEKAWAILCGLFIGIGLLPLLEGMALSKRFDILDRLRLDSPWNWFLGLVIFAGISNYIPTKHFKSSVVLGSGLVYHLILIWKPDGRAVWRGESWLILPWCISMSVLLSAVRFRSRSVSPEPDSFHALWLPFRDAWGAAWALRVLERFNQAAVKNQWPMRLQWFGLYPLEHMSEEELSAFDPAVAESTLAIFIRRFGDPDRIRKLGDH